MSGTGAPEATMNGTGAPEAPMSRTVYLVSCEECKRRKQKCDKSFPCHNCSKRSVTHFCRFIPKASKASKASASQHDFGPSRNTRKRSLDSPDDDGDLYDDAELGEAEASDALNALGYMPHHHYLVLGNGTGPRNGPDSSVSGNDGSEDWSEELKVAMMTMPAKPYADCFVDNWLGGANHHYYALYPPEFRTQYDGWWATPPNKVSPELTSLILRVCACSAQFIVDKTIRERLELDLRADAKTLALRMHTAALKLSASIAPGKGGLVHIQQQFLTAFWYKAAEKWTESWHALSTAVRSANEIGLHQDSLSEGFSEFDREMRRRLWVVLYLWDHALGSMLSRPMLINHAECGLIMPTLALERDPEEPDHPSPFSHMCLHGQLCYNMATATARTKSVASPDEFVKSLRAVVDKWFKDLPQKYALTLPDTRWDKQYSWVDFQRRYLHLIGYMSLFGALKQYVKRDPAKPASEDFQVLRAAAVQAALGLMDIAWVFFENLVTVGAKFHYAVFCIFDTTTVLCSGLVHDEAGDLPQRQEVIEALRKGLRMLEKLKAESETTANLCRLLKYLLAGLPLTAREKELIGAHKRARVEHGNSGGGGDDVPQKLLFPQGEAAGVHQQETGRSLPSSGGYSGSGYSSNSNIIAETCLPQAGQPMGDPTWTAMLARVDLPGIREHGPGEVLMPSMAGPGPDLVPAPAPISGPGPDAFAQPLQQLGVEAHTLAQVQSQPHPVDWNLGAGMQSQMNPFQGNTTNIGRFVGEPGILDVWAWQDLGLGDPRSWVDPQAAFAQGDGGGPLQPNPTFPSQDGHGGQG